MGIGIRNCTKVMNLSNKFSPEHSKIVKPLFVCDVKMTHEKIRKTFKGSN